MEPITFTYHFNACSSLNELEPQDQQLAQAAAAAVANAYAPYSQFKVGAAVLLEDGTIVTGNNQENAAYPSGLCAERVAMFYASAQHPNKKIKAIAVTARTGKELAQPVSPCGACRQAMVEYEMKQLSSIKVIMSAENGRSYISPSVANLLPFTFSADNLV